MFFKVAHSRAVVKQNRPPVVYDQHGQPIPQNLSKHLRQAQGTSRWNICGGALLVVCAAVLAVQILPTLVAEVWR
jgi:hypothetical protein